MSSFFIPTRVEKYMFFSLTDLIEWEFFRELKALYRSMSVRLKQSSKRERFMRFYHATSALIISSTIPWGAMGRGKNFFFPFTWWEVENWSEGQVTPGVRGDSTERS